MAIAYDMHPEYLPTKYALEEAEKHNLKTSCCPASSCPYSVLPG